MWDVPARRGCGVGTRRPIATARVASAPQLTRGPDHATPMRRRGPCAINHAGWRDWAASGVGGGLRCVPCVYDGPSPRSSSLAIAAAFPAATSAQTPFRPACDLLDDAAVSEALGVEATAQREGTRMMCTYLDADGASVGLIWLHSDDDISLFAAQQGSEPITVAGAEGVTFPLGRYGPRRPGAPRGRPARRDASPPGSRRRRRSSRSRPASRRRSSEPARSPRCRPTAARSRRSTW